MVRDRVLWIFKKDEKYYIHQGSGYCELLGITTNKSLLSEITKYYICEQYYSGNTSEVGSYGYQIVSNNKGIKKYVKEHYYDELYNQYESEETRKKLM